MKNVKIQKRKILNDLIEEIVSQQVEILLLEYGTGSEGVLAKVFIEPFTDTAKVISGEIQKTGAKLIGRAGVGLIGALGTLMPFFDKVPFTSKTWSEAKNAIRSYTKESVSKIDQKYGEAYKSINNSFNNPDVAFMAFAFNPGLYLGGALATSATGGALSAVESMLGGSGRIASAYNNFFNTIGIFNPRGASGGGTNINLGVGGGEGTYEENISHKLLKQYVSVLVEAEITGQQNINASKTTNTTATQQQKYINDIVNIVNQHMPESLGTLTPIIEKRVNEIFLQYNNPRVNEISLQYNNNPKEAEKQILETIKTLNNITGTQVLKAANIDPNTIQNEINASEKARAVIKGSEDAIAKNIKETIKTTKYPENLKAFFNEIKITNNEDLKKTEQAQLQKLKTDLSKDEQQEEQKKKINDAKTLEELYNNVLNDAQKNSFEQEYNNLLQKVNTNNQNKSKVIADKIKKFLGPLETDEGQQVISPEIVDNLAKKITDPQ